MIDTSWERLPFEDAIAYLREKVALPSTQWDEMWGEIQDFAFGIAGVTQLEFLGDVQRTIVDALEAGTPIAQFQQDFAAIATKRGWNPEFNPYRIELIFSQNLRTAYQAGRYQQMTDPEVLADRPYWLWRHRDSSLPRPHHKALDNKVFSASESAFWGVCYPPSGFGCKCTVFALREQDLRDRALTVSPIPTDQIPQRDRITGARQSVPAINGQPIAEPGFTSAPGASPRTHRREILQRALDRLPPHLQTLFQERKSHG